MKLSVSFCMWLIGSIVMGSLFIGSTGCANIIPPSGGPRDSMPPVLIQAFPRDSATNYQGNRITLTFNEFVTIENANENVLVSPTQKNIPLIDYKLRNITIKLRDTLEPNTTYSINFGNAIKDVNEGNIFKNFTYVFSTGPQLDENTLDGRIILAETGKVDSTMLAVLHRNMADSAVSKDRPRYIARLDGKGNFNFQNLPSGRYNLFGISSSYNKTYDDTTKPFAFYGQTIDLDSNLQNLQLYAYAKAKAIDLKKAVAATATKDKQLRFSSNFQGNLFDYLDPFIITFNRPITVTDSSQILLTDEQSNPLNNFTINNDSLPNQFVVRYPWKANTPYKLIFLKDAFKDSTGLTISKNDTLKFTTKREEDYGSLKIRLNNIELSKNPVLQLIQNELIVLSEPITQRDWYKKLLKPGSYQVRILYDTNKNGKWDSGDFFTTKRQPELVTDLNITIDVRSNWDNEKEITLSSE
ncbi:MAG: Ig-like domain-containing protein [Chitinophagaceae bacterium]|nr:Ig-like domain-containing protein [Chitinophagaceae bacterium]